MGKIDWSSLWKKEDWWACWIGWLILILAIVGVMPQTPTIAKWVGLEQAFPKGVDTLWASLVLFIVIAVLTAIGGAFMKRDIGRYLPGFLLIFILAFLAILIGRQTTISYWGIEYVIWALIFGLIISNVFGVPSWLKPAVMTEYFIKIGLVCMGAGILFSIIIKAGAVGMAQAILVVSAVWFFAYWLGRRLQMSERFASTMATGVSICGVSAAIAAGGAVHGDTKEVSYIIAWLLICAVVLIVIMPPLARAIGLPPNMAGAWIGGVIDNTGAVVAAGEVLGSKAALDAAALVKMAQNILIGFAAFFLACWATLSLERKPGAERPSYAEIWFRFPKFILGFVVASLVVSFYVEPSLGAKTAKAVTGLADAYRGWFFALCFVCIGLDTRFKELLTVGGGKPAIAYWVAQLFNAFWTLGIVWILWSGWLFPPPF